MKLSVFIATSLDGYIAREDGGLDWLPGSDGQPAGDAEDYGYGAFFESVDTIVMGRHTFETVRAFGSWPYGDKRVVVLSRSLEKLPEEFPATVRVRDATPEQLVAELRHAGACHLYVDGGQTIQEFLSAGLIDQMIVTTVPVLIGRGIPLFGRLERDQQLRHVATRSFTSGLVQSTYELVK